MNREDILSIVASRLARSGWKTSPELLEELAAIAVERAARAAEATWPAVAVICLLRARTAQTDRWAHRLSKIDPGANQVAWWGARGRLGQALARERDALDLADALARAMPEALEERRRAEEERSLAMWDACEGRGKNHE